MTRPRPSRAILLRVERLEDRRLLSASAAAVVPAASPPVADPAPGLTSGLGAAQDQDDASDNEPGNSGMAHNSSSNGASAASQGIGPVVSDWAQSGIHGQQLAANIHQMQDQGNPLPGPGRPPPVAGPGSPVPVSQTGGDGADASGEGGPVATSSSADSSPAAAPVVASSSAEPVAPAPTGQGLAGSSHHSAPIEPTSIQVASAQTTVVADPAPLAPADVVSTSANPAPYVAAVTPTSAVTTEVAAVAAPPAASSTFIADKLGAWMVPWAVEGSWNTVGLAFASGARLQSVAGPAPVVGIGGPMQEGAGPQGEISEPVFLGSAAFTFEGDGSGAARADNLFAHGVNDLADLTAMPEAPDGGILEALFAGLTDLAANDLVRDLAPWVAAGGLAVAACGIVQRQARRLRQDEEPLLPPWAAGLPGELP